MGRTPEGSVKAQIKAFLKLQPNCWFFMPVSNGMGSMGVPDFVGCYLGMFFAIEAKAPGKVANTTPLQRRNLDLIHGAHGFQCVADSVETVVTMFKQMQSCSPTYLTVSK